MKAVLPWVVLTMPPSQVKEFFINSIMESPVFHALVVVPEASSGNECVFHVRYQSSTWLEVSLKPAGDDLTTEVIITYHLAPAKWGVIQRLFYKRVLKLLLSHPAVLVK